jgi:hypothetical protein
MLSSRTGPARILALPIVLLLSLAIAGCGGGGGDSSGGSGEVGTDPIALPAKIDGLAELVTVIESKGSSKGAKDQIENQEALSKETSAAYSTAFDGAAAAYRAYADSELLKMPYVIAVRAEAPGMTIGPVVDPEYLGLAKPEREVQAVGEVECQIVWSPPVPEGQTPEPSSELTTNCQRSGSGASVFVGSAGYEGPSGLREMAGFTEAAWKAVVGE